MLDINKATKRELLKLKGINQEIAGAIIRARPFKSLNDLLRVPGIGEKLLRGLKNQGVVASKTTAPAGAEFKPALPKYPAWSPRPIAKLTQGDRSQLTVYEPRSRVIASFDITDPRIPFVYLSTEDESAVFQIENNMPRFEVKTKTGKILMDIDGVKMQSHGKIQTYSWKQKKEIGKILTKLAMNDPVYRSIGVTLGAGLRLAASSTRGVGANSGEMITAVPAHLEGIFPLCAPWNIGVSIVDDVLSAGRSIIECTEEVIENIVEECIDPIPDCLANAARSRDQCFEDCNHQFRKWYNKWMRPICKGGCWVIYGIDAAVCLGMALICSFITVTETVVHCITKSGWVPPDEAPRTGDIRLYEANDPIGYAIDIATCGYGYSHAALVCGDMMFHATADGVISSPLDYYGSRKFATVRLGLTDAQYKQLCACVQGKIGADYDYLEAITFGTIDDPGREICTMLIMNCLDSIGVDRNSLGLSGFVSPNDIARRLGAPNARNL